jgi:phosphatidylcholine synthase
MKARRAAAFAVHMFTASGSVVALLALAAAIDRDFPACFAWLGVALFIDGIDGTLARAAGVREVAVAIDGVVLDLVVDFLTYVVTPVVAIWRSDLIPAPYGFGLGLVVTFASAMYFADTRMKTGDYWFRGFPAIWNVAAMYFFVLRPPAFVIGALMILGTVGMFAPIVFVHPLRVKKLRALTIAASLGFFGCSAAAIWQGLEASLAVKLGFVAIALYFFSLPFLRHSPWAEA